MGKKVKIYTTLACHYCQQAKEYLTPDAIKKMIKDLEKKMKDAAARLEFEEAARLRDEIKELREDELDMM